MNNKYRRLLKEIAIFVGLIVLGYVLLWGLGKFFDPFGSNGVSID